MFTVKQKVKMIINIFGNNVKLHFIKHIFEKTFPSNFSIKEVKHVDMAYSLIKATL